MAGREHTENLIPLWGLVLSFAVLIFITQYGNILQEVILADEATFILVSADILDGRLPYVDYFDNKPPVLYFLMAGAMALFGENLFTVRLFGDVCLLISTLMVFLIARRWTGWTPAVLGGLIVIILHAVGPGKYTSTEALAAMFMLLSVWSLLAFSFDGSERSRLWGPVACGAFMSLATLTRTNLAIVSVTLGVFLLLAGLMAHRSGVSRWAFVSYSIAWCVPLGMLIGLYMASGVFEEFWLSTVQVPLAYAGGQLSMMEAAQAHAGRVLDLLGRFPVVFGILCSVVFLGCMAVGVRAFQRTTRPPEQMRLAIVFWVIFISITVSILKSGAAYTYYWLQLVPFVAIICAVALAALCQIGRLRIATVTVIGLAMLGTMVHTGPKTWQLLVNKSALETSHVVRLAANHIDEIRDSGDQVLAFDNHLILWYLGLHPVSRVATHPDNLTRTAITEPLVEAGYIGENELERVYQSFPEFVVTDEKLFPHYIFERPRHQEFMDNYKEVFRAGNVFVFRRKAT